MHWKLDAQSLGGGEELGYDQETYSSASESVIVCYFTAVQRQWRPSDHGPQILEQCGKINLPLQ